MDRGTTTGKPPTAFSREDVLAGLIPTTGTNPDEVEWAAIGGIFRNTLRLRMSMTPETISEEMLGAYQITRYPDVDVPEVQGLLRCLQAACARASIPVRTDPGPKSPQTGVVSFFEPAKIQIPFANAKLALTIAPGEFQWVLTNARKESGVQGARLEALKSALLEETRQWLRNGNR